MLYNFDIKVVMLYDGDYSIKMPIECQGKIYVEKRAVTYR